MMFYLPKDVFVDWWIINTSFCIFLLVSFLTLVDSFASQLAAGFYIKQVKENPGYKKANIISINAKYAGFSFMACYPAFMTAYYLTPMSFLPSC